MAVEIDGDWCVNCHRCRRVCPTSAILYIERNDRRLHLILADRCIDCDRCIPVCPASCIRQDAARAAARLERRNARRAGRVSQAPGPLTAQ
ncbi:MAG: 4Fe-4S binding protein [Dehalococcoidia bacterium]|nr:MAG: 4Fe-4S dicluster domain-containing protein [bacterium]MCE7926961.1 4Fe-4S dicluster domain-containing protein [Chloroflexi bacterium CFX7]MCK6563330.1 4Fe-4S binding protein [Dehalococcoidia bacterium]MCL4232175.1 4Fe-4S binding protein [Dehalococcoidia bacterium]NUQ55980.1 4Fe-4S binding protein [Dehalococcoidia bacterium]